MTAPAFTVFLFLLGLALTFVSVIPGLNWLLLAGVALWLPLFCAWAIDLGNTINTKDTK